MFTFQSLYYLFHYGGANYEKQRQPIFPTWLLCCKSEPRIDSLHLTDNCRVTMGKAVVNYLKGMVAAASDQQCVKVVEKAPAPTASTVDNEDELVIDVGEEDLGGCICPPKNYSRWMYPQTQKLRSEDASANQKSRVNRNW